CRLFHSSCNKAPTKLFRLPSRVIDVGGPRDHEQPFLYESRGDVGSYSALSHRWGGSNVLTTTLQSIEERKRQIPLCTLPKTMRDAIHVTRALGIRYIWIDSLCIVQDHLGDWALEAEKMGEIYKNATLTIASVLATNAESGCFADYDGRKHRPCRLGITAKRTSQSSEDAGEEQVWKDRQSYRPRGPLDTRGWVLQEEVLSTRVLSFCDDGIYWECLENDASEGDPGGHGKGDMLNQYPRSRFARVFKTSLISATSNSADPWNISLKDAWRSVVKDYTARKLTYNSDTLLAVQGLANYIQQETGWQYRSGLWSHDFHEQLCW
ncbi:HET-domain-containing protein, partial [Setomelanomma holmii]